MSDSTMLLAVFEEIEPAVKGIEKLQELGVSDEQMNVISGIPDQGSHFGPSLGVKLRVAHRDGRSHSGNAVRNIPDLSGLPFYFHCMSAVNRSTLCLKVSSLPLK